MSVVAAAAAAAAAATVFRPITTILSECCELPLHRLLLLLLLFAQPAQRITSKER
jgi:hypothetical protein